MVRAALIWWMGAGLNQYGKNKGDNAPEQKQNPKPEKQSPYNFTHHTPSLRENHTLTGQGNPERKWVRPYTTLSIFICSLRKSESE